MRRPAPVQPPEIVARRTVTLPGMRGLEVIALAEVEGHADCWLRLLGAAGFTVAQIRVPSTALRDVARALDETAGELGTAP